MSVKIAIQGKSLSILEKEAEALHAPPTAVARAIIETVLNEGIVHETLAGIDLEPFMVRRSGRVFGKGQYDFDGRKMSIAGISRETGIPAQVIRERIKRGWSVQKAATTPKMKRGFQNGEAAV